MESRPHVDPSIFNATALYSVESVHPLHLISYSHLYLSPHFLLNKDDKKMNRRFSPETVVTGQE
jgi:hypothetical protein